MNSMSWHLRNPIAFSALTLDQQLYSSLKSERSQNSLILRCLPLQVSKAFLCVFFFFTNTIHRIFTETILENIWISCLLSVMLRVFNFHFKAVLSKVSAFLISQSLKQIGDLVLMVSYICYVAQGGSLQNISDTPPSVSLVLRLIGSEVCKQGHFPPFKLQPSFTHVCLSPCAHKYFSLAISCTILSLWE